VREIQVYEHERLKVESKVFTDDDLLALQRFYGEKGVPYFQLIHKGVKFSQFVGVLQVGDLTIQVLPKIDNVESNEANWNRVLIDMLRQCGLLSADAPSSASLQLKSNSILELYFELFVLECEKLVHAGLVKKYRSNEGNLYSLKGSLQFNKHLQHNLVHAERFYTRHSIYDHNHLFNSILQTTLEVLARINTSSSLSSQIQRLLLQFPETDKLRVSPQLFNQLQYNRKTESYRKALDIAELILLNYHPDIQSGNKDVLALMFDMNQLWERWVLRQLRKHSPIEITVKGQQNKVFWKTSNSRKRLKPDIAIYRKGDEHPFLIIDTKWKTPPSGRPSDEDLRQIYAYLKMWKCEKGILLYPGNNESVSGDYADDEGLSWLLFHGNADFGMH
jgi:5-methylcytosine-specific restriction enzyme subunit McrC